VKDTRPRHGALYAAQNEGDGEGWYVAWRAKRSDSKANQHDESMAVYLPHGPQIRERAAQVIADALNGALIPPPRKPRKP
jgi:hypothetical protein